MRKNRLKEVYSTIDTGTVSEKMSRLPDFPKIIELEITNHCNFQCLMCKTGVGTSTRERGYMSEDTLEVMLDEIKGRNIAIKFVGQGEPLLHPHAIEYLRKVKKSGAIVHLTTNGSLLSEEMMQELVDMELDSIKFSFQGVNREGYTLLRRKDSFDDLIRTIERLYKIRGNRLFPYITIGTSVTNEEKEIVDDFKKMCSSICDKVEVGITTLEFIELEKIVDTNAREALRVIRDAQNQIKKRYVCCPMVYDVIALRWNGDITACCADLDGVMTLGNIDENSIKECWNSDLENRFRNILSVEGYEKLPLCKDCYDVYGWTYGEN